MTLIKSPLHTGKTGGQLNNWVRLT